MFRRKKPVFTAKEIIDSFVDDPSFGKLKNQHAVIIKKDGKRVVDRGHLYFRDGKLYSVFIENDKPNVYSRVLTGGEVSESELDTALRQSGNDINSSNILDHLGKQKVLSESLIFNYKREFLMDAFTKIVNWQECEGESDVETTTEFTIIPVDIKDAFKVVEKRTEQMRLFYREVSQFFTRSDIQHIAPTLKKKIDSMQLDYDTVQILTLCDGQNTIREISVKTGIPFFNTFREVYKLWKEDIVSFRYNALTVTYKHVMDIKSNGILDTTSDTRIKDKNQVALNPIEEIDFTPDAPYASQVEDTPTEILLDQKEVELETPQEIDAKAPVQKRKIAAGDFKGLSNLLDTLNGTFTEETPTESTTPDDLYEDIDLSGATNISQKIMILQKKIAQVEEEVDRTKGQKDYHEIAENTALKNYEAAKKSHAKAITEFDKVDNYLEKLLSDLDSVMRGK